MKRALDDTVTPLQRFASALKPQLPATLVLSVPCELRLWVTKVRHVADGEVAETVRFLSGKRVAVLRADGTAYVEGEPSYESAAVVLANGDTMLPDR